MIPVHEAGEDDEVAFIAMRYVAGSDLRSLVRSGGALEPADAADVVAQAGAALDAIHRAGFVHRDVKPANLLVDSGGHVYLTDFGLAKQVLTNSSRTGTGHWVGTLDYVAPEQIRGGHVDARADVYALGGVLHFALTGRVPFERQGDEAKLWAQLSAPPPVPSTMRRGLRGGFDAVVARAMAKDADHRYPSAGDLGRAAQAAAAGTVPTEPERVVARGAAAPGFAPTEPGIAAEASTRTALPPVARAHRRRVRPGWIAGGVGALAVAILAVLLLTRDDGPGAQVVTPTPTATATATATATSVATSVKTIQGVSDRPSGLVSTGGDLLVAGQPMSLTRIKADTGNEYGRHPKVGPDINAMVEFGGSVWMTLGYDRQVVRLDARTGKVRKRLKVADRPTRVAVDRTGLWVGTELQNGGGQVLRYDLRGTLIQAITVPEGVGGLVTGGDAIWVIKDRTNKVARLTPGDTKLVDWASLPSPVASVRYAGGALWVTLDGEDAIARVDAKTGNQRTAAAGHSPAQTVLAGGHLFVSSRNDNTVVVLDPNTLKPVGPPIEVGFNPYALVADERSVWVTGLGDNTLTRIDYR